MANSTIKAPTDVKLITTSGNITCAALSNAQGHFPVNVPSGYKAVAAVGYSLATQMWTCFGFWLEGNNAMINVRNNNTSGSQTLLAYVYVLAVRV